MLSQHDLPAHVQPSWSWPSTCFWKGPEKARWARKKVRRGWNGTNIFQKCFIGIIFKWLCKTIHFPSAVSWKLLLLARKNFQMAWKLRPEIGQVPGNSNRPHPNGPFGPGLQFIPHATGFPCNGALGSKFSCALAGSWAWSSLCSSGLQDTWEVEDRRRCWQVINNHQSIDI